MSFVKDMFREFGFAFCVSEVFPMLFESCVEVSVGSSYVKFVAVGAVDNVVITTKGLQDRNIHILDRTTVENKGKLILTEISPSMQKHDI